MGNGSWVPGGWTAVTGHSYDLDTGNETYTLTGHSAPLGLRLNKMGKVILTSCNVGAGAEDRLKKEEDSEAIIPIEEYGPLSKKETVAWLQESFRIQKCFECYSDKRGERRFKILFQDLPKLEVANVLPRHTQNAPNCTLRNLNEWIVYTLQRVNEVGLASEILAFNRLPGANNNNENVESLTTEDGWVVLQSFE